MVGFGKSLEKAIEKTKVGWEDAYLDYDKLKLTLTEIESQILLKRRLSLRQHNNSSNDDIEEPQDDSIVEKASAAANVRPPPPPPPPPRSLTPPKEESTTTTTAVRGRAGGGGGGGFLPMTPPPSTFSSNSIKRNNNTKTTATNENRRSNNDGVVTSSSDEKDKNNDDNDVNEKDIILSSKSNFFRQLNSEIEKIALFALKRQGILADSIGSLRFNSTTKGSSSSSNTIFECHQQQDYNVSGNPMDIYSTLGVELVHLLRYLCVNSIGIRKILKKYNKVFQRLDDEPAAQTYHNVDSGINNDHFNIIHQFSNNKSSVVALQSSLYTSMVEHYCDDETSLTKKETPFMLMNNNQNQEDDNTTMMLRLSLLRFQCIMACADTIRRNANILNRPFIAFLTRQSMVVTYNNLGGMDGTTKHILNWLLKLNPDDLLSMSSNQLELVWKQWAGYYHHPPQNATPPSRTSIHFIEKKDALLQTIGEEGMDDDILSSTPGGESESSSSSLKWAWGGINASSMILNLLSTALYTINYYIVAPTANHYAIKLGHDGAYGATMIGASSFSALFAAFFYSLWYTRSSIQSALICSSVFPFVGNLLYGLAVSYHSMTMAIVGRILCGFGSAEVINRQVISACVSFEGMTQASALFVASGAIGMSIGPLLAAILDTVAGRDYDVDLEFPFMPAGGIIFDHVTAPGFVMALLWLLQLVGLLILFKEPIRINGSKAKRPERSNQYNGSGKEFYDAVKEDTSLEPLISTETMTYDSIYYGSSSREELKSQKQSSWRKNGAMQEIMLTFKLVTQNPGLPITMLVFGYIEMADEVLISSCAMVMHRYFGWHGSAAGFLIASLGALVLPAQFVVERASHYYSERRIMTRSTLFIILCCFGIFNYNALIYDVEGVVANDDPFVATSNRTADTMIGDQTVNSLLTKSGEFKYYHKTLGQYIYISFLSLIFMGTIVLEGVDTSIMAKVTPKQLNDRFINSGLLATLVGTLGRVLADVMITLSAFFDIYLYADFVNATFLPLMVLAVGALYLQSRFYKNFS